MRFVVGGLCGNILFTEVISQQLSLKFKKLWLAYLKTLLCKGNKNSWNWKLIFDLALTYYRQKVSRTEITQLTNRLPPDKWSKFALASFFMNMYAADQLRLLLQNTLSNTYTRGRKLATKNWLGQALNDIPIPWTDRLLTKDTIRIMMKKSFY